MVPRLCARTVQQCCPSTRTGTCTTALTAQQQRTTTRLCRQRASAMAETIWLRSAGLAGGGRRCARGAGRQASPAQKRLRLALTLARPLLGPVRLPLRTAAGSSPSSPSVSTYRYSALLPESKTTVLQACRPHCCHKVCITTSSAYLYTRIGSQTTLNHMSRT